MENNIRLFSLFINSADWKRVRVVEAKIRNNLISERLEIARLFEENAHFMSCAMIRLAKLESSLLKIASKKRDMAQESQNIEELEEEERSGPPDDSPVDPLNPELDALTPSFLASLPLRLLKFHFFGISGAFHRCSLGSHMVFS